MSEPELPPDGKPVFLDKARAEALPYPGEKPVFDAELDAPPAPETSPGEHIGPDSNAEHPGAPSLGRINRWREIARLHAFGYTNADISSVLGYTPSRISILLREEFIQAEVQLWRKKVIEGTTTELLDQSAKDGARFIQRIIRDPNTKDSVALEAAKFAIEKTHGKARQEVNVESGTLTNFMNMLSEMRSRGESIDVTPQDVPALPAAEEPEQQADWNTWIKENV